MVNFALEHGADPNLRSHDVEDRSILESALTEQETHQELHSGEKLPALQKIIDLLRASGAVHYYDLYPEE